MFLKTLSKDKEKSGTTISTGHRHPNDAMMLALEPRLLFDAAGLIAGLDLLPHPDALDSNFGGEPEQTDTGLVPDLFSDLAAGAAIAPMAVEPVSAIVFVDTGVTDYENLINGLPSDTLAMVLEPGIDGVAQIGDVLSQYQNVGSVHIISHGAQGSINLGDAVLSNDTIYEYATALQNWGSSLAGGADILVYGCNVASGTEGQSFVAQLSDITGADVAASDDITGAANKGGDWDLETRTGIIETGVVFSDTVQQAYTGTLADIIVDSAQDNTTADAYTTLREALITANSNGEADTITFDAALTGSTITLGYGKLEITSSDGITINGDIDGDGNYDITLDGDNISRVLDIGYGASANLDGLSVTGGYAVFGGGVYAYSKSSLSIENSIVSGNSAIGGGGGISSYNDTTLTLSDSRISGNTAGYFGGGLLFRGNNTVNISGSQISDNTAAGYSGGGVMFGDYNTVTISDSRISGNNAGYSGGGIYSNNHNTLTLSSSQITDNTAGKLGGGICSYSYNIVTISDSRISDNTSGSSGGGVVFGLEDTVTISGSRITDNTADMQGGGLLASSKNDLSIENCVISSNTTGGFGGGAMFGIDNTVTMSDSRITDNTANMLGGGLFAVSNNNLSIGDCVISSNTAGDCGGGIVLNNDNTFTISDSRISGNTADMNGGGIYARDNSTLTISGSQISGNTAVKTGGGIFNLRADVDISCSTITGNTGNLKGGGIYNYNNAGSTVTVYHSTITDNNSASGSAIYTGNAAGFTMGHTIVAGQIVTGAGGITSQGYNLFTQASVTGAAGSDLLSANADLQPLDDNGGPTLTHALGDNSQAIDGGDPAGAGFPLYDQRGPGFARVFNTIDIGAMEISPPDTSNDTVNTDEDTPVTIDVLTNDIDPDPTDTLTVTGIDISATRGTAAINGNGTITYNPAGQFDHLAAGQSAVDTFTYTVTDRNGNTDTANVTVTVRGVNDNPEAINDNYGTSPDTAVATGNVLGNDYDPDDNDTLSIEGIFTEGTKGIVTNNGDGTFTYDPNGQFDYLSPGESAQDTFTYTVTDGNGGVDPAVVTITISLDAEKAMAVDDAFSTAENTGITMDVLANDIVPDDSGTLAVTGFNTAGSLGTIANNGDGMFRYDPNGRFDDLAAGETATDSFTYTVSDGNGNTDAATVTITVSGITRSGTGLIFNSPFANASFADLITDSGKSTSPWYQIWTGNEAGTEGGFVDTSQFYTQGNGWIEGADLAGLFPDYCQVDDTAIWVRYWTQAGGFSAWAFSEMPFQNIDTVDALDSVTGPMPLDQMFNDENASLEHWYRIWVGDTAGEETNGSFLDTTSLNNGAGQGWVRASELADISLTPDEPGTSQELWVQSWSPTAGNLGWEHWTVTCTEADETAQVLEPDTGPDVVENETQSFAITDYVEPETHWQQIFTQTDETGTQPHETIGVIGFNEQLQTTGNRFEAQREAFLERLS